MFDLAIAFELALWLVVSVGGVWAHGHVLTRGTPAARVQLLMLDLFLALWVWVGLTRPSLFEGWMAEDGWAEWLTFYAFGGAGFFFLRALLRHGRRAHVDAPSRWLSATLLGGTGLFCLFVAGEEISWAQRLLAFEPPEIFLEENFQQELNVHNMLTGKSVGEFQLDSKYLVMLVALVYGLLLPMIFKVAAGGMSRVGRWAEALKTVSAPLYLGPIFAAVALGELTYAVDLTGEACEALLGLAFLAVGMGLGRGGFVARGGLGGVRAVGIVALVTVLGILTPALLERVLYGTDLDRAAQVQEEIMLLKGDLSAPDIVSPRLYRKAGVHKRVFTAVRSGYFDFNNNSAFLEGKATPADPEGAEVRRDRRGYFLDPWNNPYWVRYDRKKGQVVVYSFGSNRRRDTNFERGMAITGDDIGVVWSRP